MIKSLSDGQKTLAIEASDPTLRPTISIVEPYLETTSEPTITRSIKCACGTVIECGLPSDYVLPDDAPVSACCALRPGVSEHTEEDEVERSCVRAQSISVDLGDLIYIASSMMAWRVEELTAQMDESISQDTYDQAMNYLHDARASLNDADSSLRHAEDCG